MKLFKKFILCIFVFCLAFIWFSTIKINSASRPSGRGDANNLVILGAQVRTEGAPGIRFVVDASAYKDTQGIAAFGIIVGFGNNTNEHLLLDTNYNNRKTVHAEVTELDEDGRYYITIFNIPEGMYLQDITARPYYLDDDAQELENCSVTYGTTQEVRNLGQVCLLAANDDVSHIGSSNIVDEVIQSLNKNYKKIAILDDKSDIVNIDSLVYESRYTNLYYEFAKDWNKVFFNEENNKLSEKIFGSEIAEYFTPRLKGGSSFTTEYNLYRFYANKTMSAKWGWLLDFVENEMNADAKTKAQIDVVRGKSVSISDENWNNAIELIDRLTDFFSGGGAITYCSPDKLHYTKILNYNKTVYTNITEYNKNGLDICKIGSTYTLPQLNSGNNSWNDTTDGALCEEKASYVVTKANTHLVQSTENYETSFVIGEKYYMTLTSAFAASNKGDVIEVRGPIDFSTVNTITVNKAVTLKAVIEQNCVIPSTLTLFNVVDGGDLTLENFSFDGNATFENIDDGINSTISEIKNATTHELDDSIFRNGVDFIKVTQTGRLTVKNTMFKNFACLSKDPKSSSSIISAQGKAINDKAIITLEDCVFNRNIGLSGVLVYAVKNAKANVKNCTIEYNASVRNANHGLFKVYESSILNLEGDTIRYNSYNGNGGIVGLWSGCSLNMDGSTIISNNFGGKFTNGYYIPNNDVYNNGRCGLIYVHATSYMNFISGSITDNNIYSSRELCNRIFGPIDVMSGAYRSEIESAVNLYEGAYIARNYYVYESKTAQEFSQEVAITFACDGQNLIEEHWLRYVGENNNISGYIGDSEGFPYTSIIQ